MAQFNYGDLRETALPRYIVDNQGRVMSLSASGEVSVLGTVALGAGEAHVGQVGGSIVTVTVTPSLSTAGLYAANDYVGTSATAMAFANVVRVPGGSGVIESAVLIDKALQSVSCELWLFDRAVVPPNDNAAWSISDNDAAQCIGVVPFSSYYASALNSVSIARAQNIAFVAVNRTIWGCLVTRGAPTYVSGSVVVRLSVLQD